MGAKRPADYARNEQKTGAETVNTKLGEEWTGRIRCRHAPLICNDKPHVHATLFRPSCPRLGPAPHRLRRRPEHPIGSPTPTETRGTQPQKKKRKAYTEEELNRPYSTVSPLHRDRAETQYFERLVVYSELGRTIHGSGHALLRPRDETFRDNRIGNPSLNPNSARPFSALSAATSSSASKAPNPWKASTRTSTGRRS